MVLVVIIYIYISVCTGFICCDVCDQEDPSTALLMHLAGQACSPSTAKWSPLC